MLVTYNYAMSTQSYYGNTNNLLFFENILKYKATFTKLRICRIFASRHSPGFSAHLKINWSMTLSTAYFDPQHFNCIIQRNDNKNLKRSQGLCRHRCFGSWRQPFINILQVINLIHYYYSTRCGLLHNS